MEATVTQWSAAESTATDLQSRRIFASATDATNGFALLAKESPQHWISNSLRAVSGLASLPPDWDSYGANQVNHSSILAARKLLVYLCQIVGVKEPQVGATPEGNVALCWSWNEGTCDLEVEVYPDGIRYSFSDERNGTEDCDGSTQRPELLAKILTKL